MQIRGITKWMHRSHGASAMSTLAGALAASTLLFGACGDDGDGPAPGTDVVGSDTGSIATPPGIDYPKASEGTATKSGITGVETNVQVTAPTPNEACFIGDSVISSSGPAYPFGGATIAGTTFTCNGCPNGVPEMQGRYRVHGFAENSDSVDYSIPDPSVGRADVLFVDGNTFYYGTHNPVTQQSFQSKGYFFCSMKAENSGKHLYWNDLEASDPQAIGNWTRTDVVLSQSGGKNILLWYFDSPSTSDSGSVDVPYCRIGSTTDGQVCTDPFGG